jgi:hypothetical protein
MLQVPYRVILDGPRRMSIHNAFHPNETTQETLKCLAGMHVLCSLTRTGIDQLSSSGGTFSGTREKCLFTCGIVRVSPRRSSAVALVCKREGVACAGSLCPFGLHAGRLTLTILHLATRLDEFCHSIECSVRCYSLFNPKAGQWLWAEQSRWCRSRDTQSSRQDAAHFRNVQLRRRADDLQSHSKSHSSTIIQISQGIRLVWSLCMPSRESSEETEQ